MLRGRKICTVEAGVSRERVLDTEQWAAIRRRKDANWELDWDRGRESV